MRNIVEKIVIERHGVVLATINMLDKNDNVIKSIKTTEMLANDNLMVDRETIAELCDMTLDELSKCYTLDECGFAKVKDYGTIVVEATFTRKNCFELLLIAIQNGDIEI